jgi:hypothetical protein
MFFEHPILSFSFISRILHYDFRHDLFGVVHDKIPDLMELDEREALKLFLEHPEKLSSDLVTLHIF